MRIKNKLAKWIIVTVTTLLLFVAIVNHYYYIGSPPEVSTNSVTITVVGE